MDTGRGSRSLLLTIALVVLLGLVAFSSRSGFGNSNAPAVSNTYISYAMSVFLIVFVLMIPVAIYSYFIRTKEMTAIGSRSPNKQFKRMVIGLVVIALVVYVRHYFAHGGFFGHNGIFHVSKPGTGHGKLGTNGHAQPQPHFEYLVLWIALALGAVGAVAAYIQYKRQPPKPIKPPLTFEEQVAETLTVALDDLEREADPRRAVIAAYARMERAFGFHGMARKPSETAIEYLRRVLHELSSRSDSVETLTSLFERAKFSTHEITLGMKQEAIYSLREIRESLG